MCITLNRKMKISIISFLKNHSKEMRSMEDIKQPKPQIEGYKDLITYIRKGYIKIPKFQREFVWDIKDTAKLLDSIIKGYPIGAFILWKTRERLRCIKELGNVTLPPTPEGDSVKYVLDGQQRLASIFVAIGGLEVEKKKKNKTVLVDYKKIYVDLDKNLDEEDVITVDEPTPNTWITLCDLLSNKISYFSTDYPSYIDKIEKYREMFHTYDFSTIVLEDYTMDIAVEVFTRINTTGTELTLFEIMVAKTYDENRGFDLSLKYKKLKKELSNAQYGTIPSSTILQCISSNLIKNCRRKEILKLPKDDLIDVWDDTIDAVKKAVDYFRTYYRIPASRLLPYNALLVPFSYFF